MVDAYKKQWYDAKQETISAAQGQHSLDFRHTAAMIILFQGKNNHHHIPHFVQHLLNA